MRVVECGESLVDLRALGLFRLDPGSGAPVRLRTGVADRLASAQTLLPRGLRFLVVRGYRADLPPHRSGAAVDLTLCREDGIELRLGTPVRPSIVDDPRRRLDAPGISTVEDARRRVLAGALRSVGLVNDPTSWWHWSYGDRPWAAATRRPIAPYGPLPT